MPLPINFASSPRRQLLRFVLIIFGLGCLVIGFLRSSDAGESHTLYVIDSSLSMAVEDISGSTGKMISRLDLARSLVLSDITDT